MKLILVIINALSSFLSVIFEKQVVGYQWEQFYVMSVGVILAMTITSINQFCGTYRQWLKGTCSQNIQVMYVLLSFAVFPPMVTVNALGGNVTWPGAA